MRPGTAGASGEVTLRRRPPAPEVQTRTAVLSPISTRPRPQGCDSLKKTLHIRALLTVNERSATRLRARPGGVSPLHSARTWPLGALAPRKCFVAWARSPQTARDGPARPQSRNAGLCPPGSGQGGADHSPVPASALQGAAGELLTTVQSRAAQQGGADHGPVLASALQGAAWGGADHGPVPASPTGSGLRRCWPRLPPTARSTGVRRTLRGRTGGGTQLSGVAPAWRRRGASPRHLPHRSTPKGKF